MLKTVFSNAVFGACAAGAVANVVAAGIEIAQSAPLSTIAIQGTIVVGLAANAALLAPRRSCPKP